MVNVHERLPKAGHHPQHGQQASGSAVIPKGVDQIRQSHHFHGRGSQQQQREAGQQPQQQVEHQQQPVMMQNHYRDSRQQQLQHLQQHQKELLSHAAHKQQQQQHQLPADRNAASSKQHLMGFPLASLQDNAAWAQEGVPDECEVTAFNEESPSPEADDEEDDAGEDLPNAKDFEKAHVFKVVMQVLLIGCH